MLEGAYALLDDYGVRDRVVRLCLLYGYKITVIGKSSLLPYDTFITQSFIYILVIYVYDIYTPFLSYVLSFQSSYCHYHNYAIQYVYLFYNYNTMNTFIYVYVNSRSFTRCGCCHIRHYRT